MCVNRFRSLALGAVFALLTVACGADDPETVEAESTTEPPSNGSESPATAGAVPAESKTTLDPEARRLDLCEDVPRPTTNVIGTTPGGTNVDPIFKAVIRAYTEEHLDTFGGVWTDRDAGGTFVVAFTDDPEPHRATLAQRSPSPDDQVGVTPRPTITDGRPIGEWDQTFDVVQVDHTEAELLAARDTVHSAVQAIHADVSSGVKQDLNRVTIYLPEPTEADLIELYDVVPADMVCVEGPLVSADRKVWQPGDELDIIPERDSAGVVIGDPEVSCIGPVAPLSAFGDAAAIGEAGIEGLQDALDRFLSGEEGQFWPSDGWLVLTVDDESVTLMLDPALGTSFMSFERTRAGWSWAGANSPNGCELRVMLPEGLGEVEWELGRDPLPDDTELRLLATEQACNSGQPMGDRLLGPEVVETDTEILIAFAAIAKPGEATCPDNPSAGVTVTLDRPVGDREINDGLVVDELL